MSKFLSSRCETCKSEGAYIGSLFVECPNEKCIHFSQRQKDEYMKYIFEESQKTWNDTNQTIPVQYEFPQITEKEWDDEDTKPLPGLTFKLDP